MINFFLLTILLSSSLFGAKILNYNVYDRTDRVDVMISFDTPYHGVIKQSKKHSKIIIKLNDAEIESSKLKKLSTNFLTSISITPMFEYTQIVVTVPSSVSLVASKTSDSYGLRLRFTKKTTSNLTEIKKLKATANKLSHLPTKQDEGISRSYYIVVSLLIIGIIILLVLKNKIIKKKKSDNPWLFQENIVEENKKEKIKEEIPSTNTEDSVSNKNTASIRFQKDINSKNSIIMLDYGEQSYLVLMGNSNILLDKFIQDKPTTQKAFEVILKERDNELNLLMNTDESINKEPLQAYKERASSIAYGEEN